MTKEKTGTARNRATITMEPQPRHTVEHSSASVQAGIAMHHILIIAGDTPRAKWSNDLKHIWNELDAILMGGE